MTNVVSSDFSPLSSAAQAVDPAQGLIYMVISVEVALATGTVRGDISNVGLLRRFPITPITKPFVKAAHALKAISGSSFPSEERKKAVILRVLLGIRDAIVAMESGIFKRQLVQLLPRINDFAQ